MVPLHAEGHVLIAVLLDQRGDALIERLTLINDLCTLVQQCLILAVERTELFHLRHELQA